METVSILTGAVVIACGTFFVLIGARKLTLNVGTNLMVSVGVFGTFIGIAIGLKGLDVTPDKVTDSVVKLLAGMEFAFWSSIIGMGSSILTKLLFKLGILKEVVGVVNVEEELGGKLDAIKDAIAGEGEKSMYKQLLKSRVENKNDIKVLKDAIAGEGDSSLVTHLAGMRDENRESIKSLKDAIAGEGDSSLVTQIQNMREDNKEGLVKLDNLTDTIKDQLVKSLEGLVKEIQENFGKNITELIDKIDKTLNEQFGKTFAEFNQGVQAIKIWQEEHKTQVKQLTEAFKTTGEGISQIREDCESIPLTMAKLKEISEKANEQFNKLSEGLGTFAEMNQKAREAVPQMIENIEGFDKKMREEIYSVTKNWGGQVVSIGSKLAEAINERV